MESIMRAIVEPVNLLSGVIALLVFATVLTLLGGMGSVTNAFCLGASGIIVVF